MNGACLKLGRSSQKISWIGVTGRYEKERRDEDKRRHSLSFVVYSTQLAYHGSGEDEL